MSTAGRTATDAPAASDVAAALREAPFVRLFARADGDALAAAGVLARALDDVGQPFQVGVVETGDECVRRIEAGDPDALAVAVGASGAVTTDDADLAVPAAGGPASALAFDAARELGADPDAVLALAGVIAAGETPGSDDGATILDAARERGVEQRPGVGSPTADLADGLAHSTLVHAPFSGDPEATQATLADLALPADLDAQARRRVASLVALEATEADADERSSSGPASQALQDAATERAAVAIERALAPYAMPDGPFETVEGYADVLSAAATEAPGAGVALALGYDARADALAAWRDHAAAAHRGLREATTGRYDGLFVARADDAPVETAARLLRDFRSPEPTAMVVSSTEAGVAAGEDCDVAAALATAVDEVGGASAGGPDRGYARFEGDTKAFIAAVREAL